MTKWRSPHEWWDEKDQEWVVGGGKSPQPGDELQYEPRPVSGMKKIDPLPPASGLKDSGTRRSFESGAQRDAVQGKGRFDLTSYFPLKRYAQHMEKGAVKYAARNWEKGMPLSVFLNSLENHLHKLKAGFTDEDHAAAVIWNIAGFIETEERIKRGLLPKELDDLPHTYAGQEPGF